MRTLRQASTLVYYDGPQLLEARDQTGVPFLCLLVGQEDTADRFLCVQVSPSRLERFLSGDLDLREMMARPETGESFEGTAPNGDLTAIAIRALRVDEVPSNWLPDSGFAMEKPTPNELGIVSEARKRQRAVIDFRLSPPEALQETKILADHLALAMTRIQRLVTHAYHLAIRHAPEAIRDLRWIPEHTQLEVLGFSNGSFTVHMQPSAAADLMGYSEIAKAMKLLDEVTARPDDPQMVLEAVSRYGGHFATAYKNFVQFMADTQTQVSYEWSMPWERTYSSRRISTTQAEDIYKVLAARVGLGEEERRIVGRLTKVDLDTETWRIHSDADKHDYSGRRDPASPVSLKGLVANESYVFVCDERLEEEAGTGKELKRLYLKSYSPS